jgi:nucleoside-diphosphate-sugar epimerase
MTHSELFPTVTKIKGDRETDTIKKISNTKWNYIIDLSCYYPESLKSVLKSVESLDKYIFISTCSVYDNENNDAFLRNEQSKTLHCDSFQKTDRNPKTYGNRKAECERLLETSGLPYVILRPALVFGNYDPTDRLYYWLYQVRTMDTLLLPEMGERLFSTTFVSDLVEAIIRSIEQDVNLEICNVITKPQTSIKQIVDLAREFLQTNFKIISASSNFLKEHNISQWMDMPLWIDGDQFTFTNQKMKDGLGMKVTDFRAAIGQTIEYYKRLNWPEPKYGLTDLKRQSLIEKLEHDS